MLEPLPLDSGPSSPEELHRRPVEKESMLFKVIVIGDSGSGKTSLIKRYVHGMYSNHYKATIGVDFALKEIKWNENLQIGLQLWDVAGQERYDTQSNVYFKNARGAIIMYDVSNEESMNNAEKWRHLVREKTRLDNGSYYDPPCLLLGNKMDLMIMNQCIKEEDSQQNVKNLAKSLDCTDGFSVSVKMNIGIDNAIKILVAKMLQENALDKLPQSAMDDVIVNLETDEESSVGPYGRRGCAC